MVQLAVEQVVPLTAGIAPVGVGSQELKESEVRIPVVRLELLLYW